MNNMIENGDFEIWLMQAPAKTSYQIMELFHCILFDIVGFDNMNIPIIQGADDINKPGFDAEIEIYQSYKKGSLPTGKSVWEFSVRKDFKEKANEDYKKRTENTSILDKSNITYVQATFSKWDKCTKEQWILKRKKQKIWKNVLIFDQNDFKTLINASPNAQLLFYEQIGRPKIGIHSVEYFWESKYSNIAGIKIDPTLHLTSRNKCIKELEIFLANEGRGNFKFVDSDFSQNDATAFLLAYFYKNHKNKVIWVVNDLSKIEDLKIENFNGLIIYTGGLDPSNTSLIRTSDFNVIIPRFSTESAPNSIHLNRISRSDFKEKLASLGYNESEVQRLSTISNGSISCLAGYLEKEFGLGQINCQISPEDILPIFLVGRIDGSNANDTQFIENISGKKYTEMANIATKAELQESPFARGAGRKIISTNKIEALFFLAPYITEKTLENFLKEFQNIYFDWDPKWKINEDERLFAPIRGQTTKFSDDIKRGVAESLVFITVFKDKYKNGDLIASTIKNKLNYIFNELDSWQKWASIDHYLPLLSEAASDEFLDNLEICIQKSPDIFKQLFADEKNTYFAGGCKFSGLLWALEALSHKKIYFSRVVEILFLLAKLDNGTQWANRPINSLKSMFVFWYPQTPIPSQERIGILKRMYNHFGELAENVIQNAINIHFTSESKLPFITEFDPIYKDTNDEKINYYKDLTKLLLKSFTDNPDKFIDYYKSLGFHHHLQFELLKIFDDIDKSQWDKNYKYKIWEFIKETIFCIQQFENSPNWKISKEHHSLLDKLYKELMPTDQILSISWMFDFSPQILDTPIGNDFSLKDRYYEETRQIALKKFFGSNDISKLCILIKSVPSIYVLTNSIVNSKYHITIEEQIIDLLKTEEQILNDFAKRFIFISQDLKRDFHKKLLDDRIIPDNVRLKILSSIGFNNYVKDTLSNSSKYIQDNFWKEFPNFALGIYPGFQEDIVSGLLSVDRINDAIYISFISQDTLPIDLYVKILKATVENKNIEILNHRYYEIIEIFKKIYKHPDINTLNDREIANIETLYFPLFKDPHNGIKPKFLYKEMQNNPTYYLDLIKYAYKDDEMNTRDVNKNLIIISSQILYDIDFIPGYSDEDKNFDTNIFTQWVESLFTSAKEQKYIRGTICAISRILAKVPIDDDGIWPHKALRDIIENKKNQDLEEQIAIEKINQRGCTIRTMNEGGEKERNIANKIRSNIQIISSRYPRTVRMLNIIAESYERHANRFDSELKERELE